MIEFLPSMSVEAIYRGFHSECFRRADQMFDHARSFAASSPHLAELYRLRAVELRKEGHEWWVKAQREMAPANAGPEVDEASRRGEAPMSAQPMQQAVDADADITGASKRAHEAESANRRDGLTPPFAPTVVVIWGGYPEEFMGVMGDAI